MIVLVPNFHSKPQRRQSITDERRETTKNTKGHEEKHKLFSPVFRRVLCGYS